jgi:hypothetical protein
VSNNCVLDERVSAQKQNKHLKAEQVGRTLTT